MLDLSLGMFSNYGEDQDRKVPFVSTAGDEESNISSSSSKDSVAGKDFITFGILKRDDDVVPPPPPSGETGDLFPVADARRNIEFAADDGHWLRLSSLQRNKQQVAKKSRRGPRSRSSQYRGVTFYRRTGRWESHICNFSISDSLTFVFFSPSGNIHNDLELSLGISSSSQNIKLTTSDYYKGITQSAMGLFGKHSPIYLPVTTMNPLKTVAASSGFPFITMTTSSSSSMSTSFDP
ncbi:hypothetical protein F2Q69_00061866 [Brassica cretica]|uniref:AP2/ERF domain-containing protein n=1 Tax=Brassica cretica TaxID=69181 RepID=A0A8S9RIF7_BRACR|nr:hypothetical protein F2Q69_00061866 [Brassica cretica]